MGTGRRILSIIKDIERYFSFQVNCRQLFTHCLSLLAAHQLRSVCSFKSPLADKQQYVMGLEQQFPAISQQFSAINRGALNNKKINFMVIAVQLLEIAVQNKKRIHTWIRIVASSLSSWDSSANIVNSTRCKRKRA